MKMKRSYYSLDMSTALVEGYQIIFEKTEAHRVPYSFVGVLKLAYVDAEHVSLRFVLFYSFRQLLLKEIVERFLKVYLEYFLST